MGGKENFQKKKNERSENVVKTKNKIEEDEISSSVETWRQYALRSVCIYNYTVYTNSVCTV
jgi:hypothetical protein